MIAWAIAWLWLRLDFMIDWGKGSSFVMDLLPSINLTVSLPDEEGHKRYALAFNFLIFSITVSYYYLDLFKYNEEGKVIGKLSFPECSIIRLD